VPLAILARAKAQLSIPVCAIGGVTQENIHLLKEADMISIVSAAYAPDTIAKNIASLLKALT
jgi:thiamine-phosphate pyrophosphorylase